MIHRCLQVRWSTPSSSRLIATTATTETTATARCPRNLCTPIERAFRARTLARSYFFIQTVMEARTNREAEPPRSPRSSHGSHSGGRCGNGRPPAFSTQYRTTSTSTTTASTLSPRKACGAQAMKAHHLVAHTLVWRVTTTSRMFPIILVTLGASRAASRPLAHQLSAIGRARQVCRSLLIGRRV